MSAPLRRRPARPIPADVERAAVATEALGRVLDRHGSDLLGDYRVLPPDFLRRMGSHWRMRARVMASAQAVAGDPAALVRHFDLMTSKAPDGIGTARRLAGLTYNLASFGPAIDHTLSRELEKTFGRSAVMFAMDHAHLAAQRATELRAADPTLVERIESDGEAIFENWWMVHLGSSAPWLVEPVPGEAHEPVDIVAAMAIAAAVSASFGHSGPVAIDHRAEVRA